MLKFLKKKPDELNTGEAIGYVMLVGAACYVPLWATCVAIEHTDYIINGAKGIVKFVKKKLGKEDIHEIDHEVWYEEVEDN